MMRKLLFLLLAFPMLTFAQGASYTGTPIALTRGGFPAAGARVTVCSGNVAVTFNANPPCAPYASIFSDPALGTPIAQPGFTTDGLGNYPFYCTAGATYTIVLDGSGFKGASTVWTAPLNGGGPLTVTSLTTSGPNTLGGVTSNVMIESGAAGTRGSIDLGRTASEQRFSSIAAPASQFTDDVAGDGTWRLDNTANTIRIGTGSSSSAVRINQNSMTLAGSSGFALNLGISGQGGEVNFVGNGPFFGGGANIATVSYNSTTQQLGASYNNDAAIPFPRTQNTTGQIFDSVFGTYRVTTDQTITAGASLAVIPGLSWTMPANLAQNVKFSCDLLYSQATAAASDSFGVQDVTVAPTNLEAYARADTSTTAFTAGNSDAVGVTTAVTIVTFTPSNFATVFGAHIDGLIEQPSNASTSVFQVMAQFTTNNGTIKRGSSCQVF